MGNSIRTTSNNHTTTNPTQATFKAGDAVLCPSIGNAIYKLQPNGSDKNSTRLVIRDNDNSHGFYRDGRVLPNDPLPSIFHDTPANRQAIATLYRGNPNSTDDIAMPAVTLASIASEIDGAGQALHDVSILLHMIYQEKITPLQAIAMTRLSHDATNAWAELLYSSLESINQTLSSTRFGKGGE